VKRAKRRGLLRNVAVALGNWGSPEAVPALTSALSDAEPLVRAHAAWALGRIATEDALEALASRLSSESDEAVKSELIAALGL
jgi:epoxyqueuosine reductase